MAKQPRARTCPWHLCRSWFLIQFLIQIFETPAESQGILGFHNRGNSYRPGQPILATNGCVGLVGPRFSVQLLAGTNGTPADQLAPVGPIQPFSHENGYWVSTNVAIPGVPPGAAASFKIRVWDNEDGRYRSYELAPIRAESPVLLTSPLVEPGQARLAAVDGHLLALKSFALPPGKPVADPVPSLFRVIGSNPPYQGFDPCVAPDSRVHGLRPDGSAVTLAGWELDPGGPCWNYTPVLRSFDDLGRPLTAAPPVPETIRLPLPPLSGPDALVIGTPLLECDGGRLLWGTRGVLDRRSNRSHPFSDLIRGLAVRDIVDHENFVISHVSDNGRVVAGSSIRVFSRATTGARFTAFFVARVALADDGPRLEWERGSAAALRFHYRTSLGIQYRVLAATSPGAWSALGAAQEGTGGIAEIPLTAPLDAFRFFRLEALVSPGP